MSKQLKTSVCIVGAGPSGLLLSQLLANAGIDSIVIDRQNQEYIEGRIRAGVLESGTVEALKDAGVEQRMMQEGLPHGGFAMAFDGDHHRIDLNQLVGKSVMVYGQTELTRDLFSKRHSQGGHFLFSVENVSLRDLTSVNPTVHLEHDGRPVVISCDYVAGCDGFRGVSRSAIPGDVLRTYERVYPFGWLGVLVDQPPVSHELIYANHQRGFALCSMRSESRSRYYIQCPLTDTVDQWSDELFWQELSTRIGPESAAHLKTGTSIEKSIAPLRSFVSEPMRYGNLFLAGDAAHIVPPTGAKGLNLAVADVRILSRALIEKYKHANTHFIDTYSETCLNRVWKVERFSWQMSMMLHQFPDHSSFEKKMQRAEFDYISQSEAASRTIAENYVGLPLD